MQRPKLWWSVKHYKVGLPQSGSGLLGAIVLVGVIGAGVMAVNRILQNSSQKALMDRSVGDAGGANAAALTIFAKLLYGGPGTPNGLPQIFLEPYVGSSASLQGINATSGPDWHLSQGVVTTYTPYTRSLDAASLQTIYGQMIVPAVVAGRDQVTRIVIKSIDPPSDPARPYLLESLLVEASSTTMGTSNAAGKPVVTTARIKIPPPPLPSCTLSSNVGSGPVDDGTTANISVVANGVVTSAFLTDPSGQSTAVSTAAYPPTPAAGIRASNTVLGSVPVVLSRPVSSPLQVTLSAVVNGPAGIPQNCSMTISFNPPPPAPPPPPPPPPAPASEPPPQPAEDPYVPPGNYGTDYKGEIIEYPAKPGDPYSCARHCCNHQRSECDIVDSNEGGIIGSYGPQHLDYYQWRFPGQFPGALICYGQYGPFSGYIGFDSNNNCSAFSAGQRSTEGCFHPDTMIGYPDGTSRPITNVLVGDAIWDPILQRPVRVIGRVAGPEAAPLYEVGSHGRIVRVTQNHPFFTRRGMVSAAQLRHDDELYTLDNTWQRLQSVRVLPLVSDQWVWNLTLSSSENGGPDEHALVSDGVISGDLYLQERLQKSGKPKQQNQNQ